MIETKSPYRISHGTQEFSSVGLSRQEWRNVKDILDNTADISLT
jgi:hypothetical protein